MKILFILTTFMFLLSCDNRTDDRRTEINSLQSSLKIVLHENQRQLNLLELKENGNLAAKPYRELCLDLNKLILSSIDTTFNNLTSDTGLIKNKLSTLTKKYTTLISTFEKSSPHKLFLQDDRATLIATKFDFIFPTNDILINHFLIIQNILHKHMLAINIIANCTSNGCIRFFQIENAGYAINSIQKEKITKIKLYFRFPSYYADYKLIDLINITDNENRPLTTIAVSKTENDTLKITLNNASQKSYTANVKYLVLIPSGDKVERVIKFPFALW